MLGEGEEGDSAEVDDPDAEPEEDADAEPPLESLPQNQPYRDDPSAVWDFHDVKDPETGEVLQTASDQRRML